MSTYLSERSQNVQISGIRIIFEMVQKMKDVIRLDIGEPDFDTPQNIKDEVIKALNQGYTHYMSSAGFIELREAIAEKLQKDNNLAFNPNKEVTVTVGASSAINLCLLSFINPGEEVLIPDPGWPQYQGQIRLSGGVPVGYPTPEKMEFKPDIEALEKKITKKSKVMIINTPNNPTGTILSKNDLEQLANIVEQHDLIVISDEVYEKIRYQDSHTSFATLNGMKERTLTVNGFSKTYAMTGWRLGYVAGSEEYISQITKMNIQVNSCPPAMTQRAAIEALRGSQKSVEDMLTEYRKRRQVIIKGLKKIEGITCLEPGGAFYVFPNISDYQMSSMELTKYLITNAQVTTIPGEFFGEQGEKHLRLSYANSIPNIEKALQRIEDALRKIERAP